MQKRIQEILESKENSKVEFKTSFNSDVIETVCAFSNSRGGMVFIGISDHAKIVGIETVNDEVIKNFRKP